MSLPLTLQQLATALGCDLTVSIDSAVTGTAIDSRKVKKGDLFIALTGQQVDGHDYLAAAREAGAVAALVSQRQEDSLPQLVVDDVTAAFADIAKLWRANSNAKIVAVTGSNGKTTLKEMIATVLSEQHHTIATQGNLNNQLGVPLTLTRLSADHDFAVIEMGANHLGEIAHLVEMAKPAVAIINNVGAAHLEGFGSIDGVVRAKGEIFSGLPENGIGVMNADMPYLDIWRDLLGSRQSLTFGLDNPADIQAEDIQAAATSSHFMVRIENVCHFISLPLPGLHNIANALAAIAVCRALDVPVDVIVKGLGKVEAVKHRLQLRTGVAQSLLIDDTYNANPSSFKRALETLQNFSGEHWLVLGDFGELGANAADIHRQLGIDAKASGVSRLFTIGQSSALASEAFGEGATHYDSIQAAEQILKTQLNEQVNCLIKGSRFMQLDKLADALAIGGQA